MYLKPIARINITVPIPPTLRVAGATMSTWEIMDKMRELILPDEFVFLRLLKSAGEVYRFEGELESKAISRSCLTRLDNTLIRMETTGHEFRLRAAEAKLPYPTRTEWETFFRESKGMNETKPGERADTIHIEGLPIRWFQVSIGIVDEQDEICSISRLNKLLCKRFKLQQQRLVPVVYHPHRIHQSQMIKTINLPSKFFNKSFPPLVKYVVVTFPVSIHFVSQMVQETQQFLKIPPSMPIFNILNISDLSKLWMPVEI